MMMGQRIVAGIALALLAGAGAAEAPAQQEADGYTRYELLAPETHKFRITYAITATTPGATVYYNPIRPGSTASDEAVFDRATGQRLRFAEVDGTVARAGGVRDAKPADRYIRVTLLRPVPTDGGGGRIEIDKTYADAASYRSDGDRLIFDRPLGVKKNAVVLPPGYVVASCNYPSQVIRQPDGRIAIAFWNVTPAAAPLVLTARRAVLSPAPASAPPPAAERARQDRDIVYDLQPPERHAFALTHDYTETEAGIARYVNIVRAGSTVSDPSARDLDTGAALRHEVIRGEAIRQIAPDADPVDADTVAVVFHFPPVPPGGSRRLRFAETYTDPARYTVTDGVLVWHRSFGRADNAVILPAGWELTGSSIPATVSRTAAGRVRLDFLNPRPDEIDVLVTAQRAG